MGKKSKILIYILLIYLCGCEYQNEFKDKTNQDDSFLTSKVLISRGGLEIELNDSSLVKTNHTDEVYKFEIKAPNILVCSKGYGKKSNIYRDGINDLTFDELRSSDTVFLSKKDMLYVQKLLKRIYSKEEYLSKDEPTDNWLVNLQIEKKRTIYYLGESIDVLNLDYLHLIDKIVEKSPLKVKYYR